MATAHTEHAKQHEAAPKAAGSFTVGLANVGTTITSTAGSIASIALNGKSTGPTKRKFTLVDGARQAAMGPGVAAPPLLAVGQENGPCETISNLSIAFSSLVLADAPDDGTQLVITTA
jgi:hypothetical protein